VLPKTLTPEVVLELLPVKDQEPHNNNHKPIQDHKLELEDNKSIVDIWVLNNKNQHNPLKEVQICHQ